MWSSPYPPFFVIFTVSTVFTDGLRRFHSFQPLFSPYPQFSTIVFTVSTVFNHGLHRIHSFQPWSSPYPSFFIVVINVSTVFKSGFCTVSRVLTMVFTVSPVFNYGLHRTNSFHPWSSPYPQFHPWSSPYPQFQKWSSSYPLFFIVVVIVS